jgi:hypothetical protein
LARPKIKKRLWLHENRLWFLSFSLGQRFVDQQKKKAKKKHTHILGGKPSCLFPSCDTGGNFLFESTKNSAEPSISLKDPCRKDKGRPSKEFYGAEKEPPVL